MSVMYYNPSSEEMIYNEDGSGTGTYSIKAGSAEDEYEITINVEIDGMTISGNYKGKFKTDAPAVKENEYYLTNGTPVSINSVLIDKKSNETMCDIYLAGGSGLNTVDAIKAADPIIIRMPESALNDDLQSFSGNHSLSITYKSTLYNYESSQSDLIDGGNASVTLDGDNSIIEFKLFNIRNYEGQGLTGYYNGTVTIIE